MATVIPADELQIEHMRNALHWRLIRAGNSVEAKLIKVWYLHIAGKTKDLSPRTNYRAYFVYKLEQNAEGFDVKGVEVIAGNNFKVCCLDPSGADQDDAPTRREDGWLEISMGSFNSDEYSDCGVDLTVLDHNDNITKCGLSVKGFEVRPI